MTDSGSMPAACRRLFWPALALVAVLLFNLLFTPGFFRLEIRDGHLYGSLIDILNRGTPILLAALGMTLVIATAGVDLSVGAVAAIAGTVAALLITHTHAPLALILAIPLCICVLAGLCNGLLVVGAGLQPIVATLVLMVAGRGVAQLLGRGQIITFEHAGFAAMGGGYFAGLPCTVSIVAAAYVLAGVLTRRTALGLFIESVGDSPTASYYAGVPVGAVKLFVYAFSGFCAGLAGLVVASDIKAADANNAGLYLELDAILAVVVGGSALTGGSFSLAGTMLGALIIQTLTTTILTRGVPVEYTLVVKALAVLGVCLLQSAGLRELLRRSAVRT